MTNIFHSGIGAGSAGCHTCFNIRQRVAHRGLPALLSCGYGTIEMRSEGIGMESGV